jgi:transposase
LSPPLLGPDYQQRTIYFEPIAKEEFPGYLRYSVESWKRMLYDFMKDTQEWLEPYHMRSILESVNSMIKRKMPYKIKKRLPKSEGIEE